jgi:hypothetical protein
VTRVASVDAAGNWSVTFSALDIPDGTYTTTAQISTQDAAGNTATTTKTFQVDTEVEPLTSATQPGGADGIVSAAEADQGFVLNGQVEQGSSVTVTIGGLAMVAQVTAGGAWSVNVPETAIPSVNGESVSIQISATDMAGNTRSITETMVVDTVAPDAPDMTAITRDQNQAVRGIVLESSDNDIAIDQVSSTGGSSNPKDVAFEDFNTGAETTYNFEQFVPDGSHLVVMATDNAGNASGTYVVVNDPSSAQSDITVAGNIGGREVDTIDLEFTDKANLTITEAQIVALTGEDNTVKVLGNNDDSVRISGATRTGTVNQDGQSYNAYELGDATILIDDEVTNVSTI